MTEKTDTVASPTRKPESTILKEKLKGITEEKDEMQTDESEEEDSSEDEKSIDTESPVLEEEEEEEESLVQQEKRTLQLFEMKGSMEKEEICLENEIESLDTEESFEALKEEKEDVEGFYSPMSASSPSLRRGKSADRSIEEEEEENSLDITRLAEKMMEIVKLDIHSDLPLSAMVSGGRGCFSASASVYSEDSAPNSMPSTPKSTAHTAFDEILSVLKVQLGKKPSHTDASAQFALVQRLLALAAQEDISADPVEQLKTEVLKGLKRLATLGTGLGRPPLLEAQAFLAALLRGQGDPRLGVEQNLQRSFNLSLQASKQNHPDETYWTALAYEKGTGTKKDAYRALSFYRKAASMGHVNAMHRLALALQHGDLGQEANPKEAFTWLKRAAALSTQPNSNPAPIHDLALLYEKGGSSVVIPDEVYSFKLFEKAARMGHTPSQSKLGCCYEFGRLGCKVEPELSIKWYRTAAEHGDAAAELALSGWHLTGAPGGILPQSDTEAMAWARKAAEKLDARAEYAVGRFCELGIGISEPAPTEALKWYKRAALQGHRKAKRRRNQLKKTLKSSSSGFGFVKAFFGRWR